MWRYAQRSRSFRHPPEYRMLLPFKSLFGRPPASELSIDFRPCEDAGRPRQRKIEHCPLENRLLTQPSRVAHELLTGHHVKGVDQMAHHLMRRHPSPTPHAVRTHLSQPLEDFDGVTLFRQRLHRVTGPAGDGRRRPRGTRRALPGGPSRRLRGAPGTRDCPAARRSAGCWQESARRSNPWSRPV